MSITMSSEAFAKDCQASVNDCNYYSCREEKAACGERGYYLESGDFYCKKFLNGDNRKYSKKGKIWLAEVRLCLQEELNKVSSQKSCNDVEDAAFESHIPCYLKTNFCALPLADKRRIIFALRGMFFQGKVIGAGFSIITKCFSSEEL